MKQKVVFIGAGNVATQLSIAMQDAGFDIVQVFSRTEESARRLANRLNGTDCSYVVQPDAIIPNGDLYIFAVKDDALEDVIKKIPSNDGLWIHTAGSLPIDLFDGYAARYGVIYPMQTLSKNRRAIFSSIPLLIEGNTPESAADISVIAGALSGDVRLMPSEKRKYLHLAAVFACNFTNRMYAIAAQILREHGIDWQLLQPLIDETAAKLHTLHPEQAQTGPAIRYDRNVIDRHLAMLKDSDIREIYELISQNIHQTHLQKTNK